MKIIYEPRGRAREYSALAANLYSGCNHGCKYCYAPACLRRDRESFYENPAKRKNIIEQLTKDCQELEGKCKDRILLCFTCDPYQELEQELRITRAALELFYIYNLSFQVLTKAGTKAERDYDLYKPGDAFATTLTFMDEKKSLYYEPNAALPHDRIQAIKDAKAQGIETWVSFEPILNASEVFKLLDATHEYVDLYKVGKVSNFQTDEPIDWKRFGHEMVNRLEKYGKKYYIKKDLQKCM